MTPMQFLDEKYKNARDVGYKLCTTIICWLVTVTQTLDNELFT
jgi:hypothetical protein